MRLVRHLFPWWWQALSVMTEMQLNPADGKYDQQDCENKAFTRMLPRLKEEFPHQPFVHLLDSGYCNGKTTTFAWLTNIHVDRDNVMEIAQGGRKRWTIENEGFNEQKTGYELEHFCDCKSLETMTALYLLVQIAHLFMQLLARSNLIEPALTLGFLAALVLEAWRNLPLPEDLFDPGQPRFQIRFARAPTEPTAVGKPHAPRRSNHTDSDISQ